MAAIQPRTGPQGPQGSKGDTGATGPTGVVSATAPVTYTSGTQTVAISLGTGLTTSDNALVPDFGTTSGKVAQGNDSRFTDARTPTAHKASHATGGNDALAASDIGAVTLAHLRDALGQSATAIDTVPRQYGATTTAPATGQIYFCFFTPVHSVTVSQMTMASGGTAAASLTLARMGLYTFDGTTATLVAQVASDTTLFTTQNTAYTRSFDTTGGYPATYALTAGERYAAAVICVGTTMPTLVGSGGAASHVASLAPRVAAVVGSQSDLLATRNTFSNTFFSVWARFSA